MAVMPEEQLGIVILCNQTTHSALSCLMNQLIDRIIERPYTPWEERIQQAFLESKKRHQEHREKLVAERKRVNPLSL